jgi:lipoprotein-anchoring transpeptidase ErfK/SrfK
MRFKCLFLMIFIMRGRVRTRFRPRTVSYLNDFTRSTIFFDAARQLLRRGADQGKRPPCGLRRKGTRPHTPPRVHAKSSSRAPIFERKVSQF